MDQQQQSTASNNPLPPLAPAPTELPPVVNPPRLPVTNGTNPNNQAKPESTVPVHTQFESLSLNTPLQPPTNDDLSSQQFGSVQINNEFSGSQESLEENDPTINPQGDLSLTNDDGTRGRVLFTSSILQFSLGYQLNRISEYCSSKHVDTERYQRIQRYCT